MKIAFSKYQGTGNDFVMIDNRSLFFPKDDIQLINTLCHRNFGIGADGLILLENDDETDFRMVYYNADGNESTMCGNGGRCIVAFAKQLGIINEKATFIAIDGLHTATINHGIVSLGMIDVDSVDEYDTHVFADTGSPHHVTFVENLDTFPVFEEGKRIRNEVYGDVGSNVNFVEKLNSDYYRVRTYERGVEDETLACGTGVTAVALAIHKTKRSSNNSVKVKVEGGELQISFDENNGVYSNVVLSGPATFVFSGSITV